MREEKPAESVSTKVDKVKESETKKEAFDKEFKRKKVTAITGESKSHQSKRRVGDEYL